MAKFDNINSQQNKSGLIHAIMYTTSKRIELKKVPIAQALKFCEFVSKPEKPGLSSSIRLEVVYIIA